MGERLRVSFYLAQYAIFLQSVGAAGRIALPGLRGGLVQKFLFFNLSVIFSLARMGNVDYPSHVARQGGPTEMPFRLLGFSCWDDRSGRFFFAELANGELSRSTSPKRIFSREMGIGPRPQIC